jgi:hypothetical protein
MSGGGDDGDRSGSSNIKNNCKFQPFDFKNV